MKRGESQKIAIWVLSLAVAIQFIVIAFLVKPRKIIKPAIPVKGKIAIVLDDWGYNLNNLGALQEIKYPLTVSILPNLGFSKRVAQEAHRKGFEAILHLPMEPYEKYRLERNTIKVSMSEQEIKNILVNDLESMPYLEGVSNHMGSRATADARTIEIILKELKKRRLYFLDSFVVAQSVCFDIAQKTHTGYARRDIFLDNSLDQDYIKAQLIKLKNRASVYGSAIGIGHDRKATLEVLAQEMPRLAKEGYKFVFVSELAK